MNWPELMQLVRSGESGDRRFLSRVKSVDELGPILTALASGSGGHIVIGIDINQLHFLGSEVTLEWIETLIQDYCNPFFEIKFHKIQRDSKSVICIQVFEGKLKPFFYKKKCFLFEDGLLKMAMNKFEPESSLESAEQQVLASEMTKSTETNTVESSFLFNEKQMPTQKEEKSSQPQPGKDRHPQSESELNSGASQNSIPVVDGRSIADVSSTVANPAEYVDAREFSRKKDTNVGESAWRSANLLEVAAQPVVSENVNKTPTHFIHPETVVKTDVLDSTKIGTLPSLNNKDESIRQSVSSVTEGASETSDDPLTRTQDDKTSVVKKPEETPPSAKEVEHDSFVRINYKMAPSVKKKEVVPFTQSSIEHKSKLETLVTMKKDERIPENGLSSLDSMATVGTSTHSVSSPNSGISGFGVNKENIGFEDKVGLVTTESLSNSEDISEEGQFLEFENALNNRQSKAIAFVLENGSIRNKEYRHLLSVSHKTAHIELVDLVSKSLLQSKGFGRSTCYILQEKSRSSVERFAKTLA
ncbi:hypothetical protein HOH45_01730 [bacterium]|nr:hypothetical protein [bacterium]